jgi:hypothetical protein
VLYGHGRDPRSHRPPLEETPPGGGLVPGAARLKHRFWVLANRAIGGARCSPGNCSGVERRRGAVAAVATVLAAGCAPSVLPAVPALIAQSVESRVVLSA